jgi:hypothetical protein
MAGSLGNNSHLLAAADYPLDIKYILPTSGLSGQGGLKP